VSIAEENMGSGAVSLTLESSSAAVVMAGSQGRWNHARDAPQGVVESLARSSRDLDDLW
jgi:hypothetical protein